MHHYSIEQNSIKIIIALNNNYQGERTVRRKACFLLLLLICFTANASLYHSVYAVDFSLILETDKSLYGIGEAVNVAGNLTLDGSLVPDGLVALEVNASSEAIIYRTLNTGTDPPETPGVHILNATITDGSGNPLANVYKDGVTQYYIRIYFNNSQTIPIKALVTVTILDSNNYPIHTQTYSAEPIDFNPNWTYVWMAPWIVPEDAELGAAKIYANAYTKYPQAKGTPHCPEKSSTFNISLRGSTSFSSQAGEASLQMTGNFNTTFRIKKFGGKIGNYTISVSSFKLVNITAYIAFDSVTFEVIVQGDLNHDNWVDIFDIVIVAAAFGSTPPTDPRADVNGDGTVDIFDMVTVAAHYGEWGIP